MNDERLQRLEERLAWQEDLIGSLNEEVVRLNRRQGEITRQLQLLYRDLQRLQGAAGGAESVEIPPHY